MQRDNNLKKNKLSVEVESNKIRCDLDSESVEKAYPDLPNIKNDWSKHSEYVNLRKKYLYNKDLEAYETIKEKFPGFRPPKS